MFGVCRGVEGGVIGDLGRFVAFAPRRWRGVSFGFIVNIGCDFVANVGVLIARGMREGLVVLDAGVC